MSWFSRSTSVVIAAFVVLSLLSPQGAAAAGRGSYQPLIPVSRPETACPVARCSKNWAGYDVTGSPPYTSIGGTWTLPASGYQAPPPFGFGEVATWVGIGGLGSDHSLIQIGTTLAVKPGGKLVGYAWYELLPMPLTLIPAITVKPGDSFTAGVIATGPSPTTCPTAPCWTLRITNATLGQTFSSPPLPYQSSEASAEWIVEAPLLRLQGKKPVLLPLLEFPHPIYFDLNEVNEQSPAFTTREQVALFDPRGQTANPSAPDGNGDGFSVCWGSGTALSSCSPPSS